MANYNNLIADIEEHISSNGTQAINGAVMQVALKNMISKLGTAFQFGGQVQPADAFPFDADARIVFLACTPGTYTNFGGLVVADGEVAIITYDGSWTKVAVEVTTKAEFESTASAINAELSQLGQEVTNYILGKKYIYTGELEDLSNGMAAKIPIVGGKKYVYKGLFTSGSNAIVFTDSSGNILDYYGSNAYEYVRTAPQGAAFALVTFNYAKYYDIIVYDLVTSEIIWSPKDSRGVREEIEYFDVKNYTDGLYPNSNQIATNSAYFAPRGMIPISPGDVVKWDNTTAAGSLQFYDASGALLDYWGATSYSSRTAPANTAYCWIGFKDSEIKNAEVIINNVVAWKPAVGTLPELEKRVSDLEEKSNYIAGVKLSSSGTLTDDSSAVLMDISIPCANGDIFTVIKGKGNFVVYNSNGVKLDNWGVDSGEVSESRTITISNLPTAAFCRVAFQASYLDVACLKNKFGRVLWCANIEDQANVATNLIADSIVYEYNERGILAKFYQQYIGDKASEVVALDAKYGQNGDSFIFLTDPHIERNYNHSSALVKYLYEHTAVKRFLCGGDIVASPTSESEYRTNLQRWMSQYRFLPVFITRGNHDYISSNAVGYGILFKPLERIVNTYGEMYYCLDNDSQKIRYIILDTPWTTDDTTRTSFDYDAQLSWMADRITEKDSSWRVLIMQHILFTAKTEDGSGNIIAATRADVGDRLVTALGNLSSGARVLGVISGHTHWDWVEYGAGVPLIATTCDASYDKDDVPWSETRAKGTIMEQAFDVVHLDFAGNRIIMTRIGYGPNRIVNIAENTVAINGTVTLTPAISGTMTWWSADTAIAIVSTGTVTGISSGSTFVRARNDSGDEEYFQIVVNP